MADIDYKELRKISMENFNVQVDNHSKNFNIEHSIYRRFQFKTANFISKNANLRIIDISNS